MSVINDSSYAGLARSAASALGTSSPAIVRAILSQWQCELGAGDAYPPRRNNPGNVAEKWTKSLGLPYTVETPNPQPSNPIVTFSSPSLGAQAYAMGLRQFSRYAGVRAAAAKGDGEAFIRAVIGAGYGGGVSCALSVYRGSSSVGTGSGSVGSGETVSRDETYYKLLKKKFGVYVGRTYGEIIGGGPYMPDDQIPETFRAFMTRLGRSESDVFTDADLRAIAGVYEGLPSNDLLGAIAAAIAGIPAGVAAVAGPLVVNVGALGLAVLLIYSGLRDVLGISVAAE